VVLRGEGQHLRARLKPGQRLVSKEGDLWRWDGFTQAAEAPTPAARRLAEKNRLGDLSAEAEAARAAAETMKADYERLQVRLRAAAQAETDQRQRQRAAARAVAEMRDTASAADRERAQTATKISALEEARARLGVSRDEAAEKSQWARADLAGLVASVDLTAKLETARARAVQERAATAEARAALQSLSREAEARARRAAAIGRERQSWQERRARASSQIAELDLRLAEAAEEQARVDASPGEFLMQRRALMDQIETAEAARAEASDRRAGGENRLAEADRAARLALEAMSAAREARAGSEARVEAARQRLAETLRAIAADLDCEPAGLAALAGLKPDAETPPAETVARQLETLKADREKLGAVNLRAEDELVAVEEQRGRMTGERDDLTEAIKRLRQAISNLNREGRERLLAAFDKVNGHFKELFTTLFGGGEATLQLVESDDPLEAGLEILAKPPGKKPQTMTLLSGGEQALTAMSLIFAVFLTNPSPICVLDEVDAPLDDSNVERFCDLLEEMRKKTDTRFVTITHNPITMARMDRLFGVTMAERGVSQLVSVDLEEAERFLEAS
jgi:chromosome segregation protein